LAPIQRDDFAGVDLEIDALQRSILP